MSESTRSELQFKSQLAKVGTENKSRFFKVPKSEFRQRSEESHPCKLRQWLQHLFNFCLGPEMKVKSV